MTDSPLIPGSHSRPIAPDGKFAAEWYRYFRDLIVYIRETDGNSEELAQLEARVAELEAQGAIQFLSPFSVQVLGDGPFTVQLVGDNDSPGASYFYGTNELGAKGFYQRLLETLADVDVSTPPASGDALVYDGAAWAPSPVLLNPMTTEGDLIVGDVGGVPIRLPAGSDGDVLSIVGGVPTYTSGGGGGGGEGGIGVSIGTYSTNALVIPVLSEATSIADGSYSLTGEWFMWCYPSGSIEIDVWKDVFGTIPTVADSICGGSEPAIVGGTFATGSFTGPVSVDRTDTLIAHINSNADVKWVKLLLVGDRV